jgi:spore germination protein YaaH/flagellar hook assembly protein FlgD
MENAVSVRHLAAIAVVLAAVVWPLASAPCVAARGLQSEAAVAMQPSLEQGRVLPTVHYEDAMRHSGERLAFTPGDRASIPFRPRADDGWLVDGAMSRALPAGRLSGREMASETGDLVAVDPRTPPEPSTPLEPPIAPDPAIASDPSDLTAGSGIVLARATVTVPSASLTPIASVGAGLSREVFGFLPYWELSASDLRLDYASLSTIAYFGVGADRDGYLVKRQADDSLTTGWAGWTSSRMTSVLDDAHKAGTRVVLTVERFSWTAGQTSETVALLSSSTARARLARQIAAAVHSRGADGVNLDFEPIPSGQTDNFTALVRRVRVELNALAPGYQLTFDSTGYIGNYDITALTAKGAADAVFVMGYDYRGSGASTAGSLAPLGGPSYDIGNTLDAYLSKTSRSKIILGVPYYGRAWSTTSDALYSQTRTQGATYGYSATAVYTTAIDLATTNGTRYDTIEQAAWTLYKRRACSDCPLTWRQLYFDDARALGAKYDVVNARGLRGAGIWALGYDGTRPELAALLRSKFGRDRTPPEAGVRRLGATAGDEGIPVGWAGRDDRSGVVAYDVQVAVDGAPWEPWLTRTTLSDGTYLGETGHGYAFRVRALDGRGNWSAWTHDQHWIPTPALAPGGFGRVVTDGLAIRAGASTTSTRLGTLNLGDIVAIREGPRAAEGYQWYRVVGPVREWSPFNAATLEDVWVAGASATTPFLAAAQAPNATAVDAVISDLTADGLGTFAAATAAGLTPPPRAFSPNGDGTLDMLRLSYQLDRPVDSMEQRVYRSTDRAFLGSRTLSGTPAGAHTFDWDGKLDGVPVADGRVLLQLRAVIGTLTYSAPAADMTDPSIDRAPLEVTIDRRPPVIESAAVSPPTISPDGDGWRDHSLFRATVSGRPALWQVTVLGEGGALREYDGTGGTVSADWDGRDDAGAALADGSYTLRLETFDALGNRASVDRHVTIDTLAPTATLRANSSPWLAGATRNAFSPDGDGVNDTTRLSWSLSEPGRGLLTVADPAGQEVLRRELPWGVSGGITWDGRDAAGRAVADGDYRLTVTARDYAGNDVVVRRTLIVTRTAGFLRASPYLWHPSDGDALAASGSYSFRLKAGATTTLQVVGSGGSVVRTAWSGRALAPGIHDWVWRGRLDTGGIAAPGTYQIRLSATRDGVTQVFERPFRLAAFSISVSRSPLREDRSVTIVSRSAEPLSGRPMVTLAHPDGSRQSLRGTRLADGRWSATFMVSSGSGPATITVSGVDVGGGTNRSTRTIAVLASSAE